MMDYRCYGHAGRGPHGYAGISRGNGGWESQRLSVEDSGMITGTSQGMATATASWTQIETYQL